MYAASYTCILSFIRSLPQLVMLLVVVLQNMAGLRCMFTKICLVCLYASLYVVLLHVRIAYSYHIQLYSIFLTKFAKTLLLLYFKKCHSEIFRVNKPHLGIGSVFLAEL